jgi:hypothetical protein
VEMMGIVIMEQNRLKSLSLQFSFQFFVVSPFVSILCWPHMGFYHSGDLQNSL